MLVHVESKIVKKACFSNKPKNVVALHAFISYNIELSNELCTS
jgi:hypothetical protein